MTIEVRIGNAYVDTCYGECIIMIKEVEHFEETEEEKKTGWHRLGTNEISSSGSGWYEFLEITGLAKRWKPITDQMRCVWSLNVEMYKEIKLARKAYKKSKECEGWALNMLTWFKYWVGWAVKNCETPAISFS